jgi:rRNA maturation RNase YbeY
MSALRIRNRQKIRPVNLPLLRKLAKIVLRELAPEKQFDLAVHLVQDREMEKINLEFLGHSGSTDVITFPYTAPDDPEQVQGEIVISMDTALLQARQYKTTWQNEIVRYLIHGILHLHGHDDVNPAKRRAMKKEEKNLLGRLSRQFPLSTLEAHSTLSP